MSDYHSQLDDQVDELVARCLEAEERGTGWDSETLADIPADVRSSVIRCLQSHRRLQALTEPLRRIAEVWRNHSSRLLEQDIVGSAGDSLALPCRFGSYELLERIGTGAMGVVYRAQQGSLRRQVALKILRLERSLVGDHLRRFRNEAELAGQLDHPGIVPVYEVGTVGESSYIAMKLLAGGDLGHQLAPYREDPRAAARLIAKVARAVHHAHQHGILHRDLKPSNVLLDLQGEPHVSDFGLARQFVAPEVSTLESDKTQSGILIGTPAYMAPEQAAGDRHLLTTATDVYGLGAVLYALLTGRPPCRGATVLDTLMLVREGTIVSPRQLNPPLARDLETICLKAVACHPGKRYSSAAALADDLERWLAGQPVEARPVGMRERIWRWCLRNPAVAALSVIAAGLSVILVGGLIVGTISLRVQRNEAMRHRARAELQEKLASDQAQKLRRHLYAARINQSWRAWQARDLWQARRMLDQLPADASDLLSFEYHYMRHTCLDPLSETGFLAAHRGAVYGVAFSPDGKLLATAGEDRTAILWDATTRRRLFELPGQDDDQNCTAFHPSGKILVTTSEDGFVWTWDVTTGQRWQLQLKSSAPVLGAAFSPAGKHLALALGDGQVRLYPFPEHDQPEFAEPRILSGHEGSAESVCFSPDGKILASGARDHTARLWDATTGECLHILRHESDVIKSIAFAHHGSLVAAGCYGGALCLWNSETGELVREIRHDRGHGRAVAFSPDDSRLASCHDSGHVCLWNVETGECTVNFVGHPTHCWALAFSPDCQTLATTDHDGRVLFWDPAISPETVRVVLPYDSSGQLADCLYLPDQRLVAVAGSDGAVRLVDTEQGDVRKTLPREGRNAVQLGCSADGATLAVSFDDGQVWLWDVEQQRWGTKVAASSTWPQGVALSPDGTLLLTLGGPEGLIVWDARSSRQLACLTLAGSRVVAMAAVGTTLATQHADGQVAFWDYGDWSRPRSVLAAKDPGTSAGIALSNDGQHVAVQSQEVIELINANGHFLSSIPAGGLNTLRFSPDGRTLATSGRDKSITLWHVATGQELMTVPLPARARCLSFSPDGLTLLASVGGELLAFDATTSTSPR